MDDRNGGSMIIAMVTNAIFFVGLMVLLGGCVNIFAH